MESKDLMLHQLQFRSTSEKVLKEIKYRKKYFRRKAANIDTKVSIFNHRFEK
jgi:hypothetical protein